MISRMPGNMHRNGGGRRVERCSAMERVTTSVPVEELRARRCGAGTCPLRGHRNETLRLNEPFRNRSQVVTGSRAPLALRASRSPAGWIGNPNAISCSLARLILSGLRSTIELTGAAMAGGCAAIAGWVSRVGSAVGRFARVRQGREGEGGGGRNASGPDGGARTSEAGRPGRLGRPRDPGCRRLARLGSRSLLCGQRRGDGGERGKQGEGAEAGHRAGSRNGWPIVRCEGRERKPAPRGHADSVPGHPAESGPVALDVPDTCAGRGSNP